MANVQTASTSGQIQERAKEHLVSYIETTVGQPPAIFAGIMLGSPPRGCKSIARLRGRVQVRVGSDPTTVQILDLKSVLETVLTNTELAKVVRVDCWEQDGLFDMRVYGDPVRLREIAVVDANGKVLDQLDPQRWIVFKGFLESMKLPRPVDHAMSLRINLYRTATVVTVPFDLKNIALP